MPTVRDLYVEALAMKTRDEPWTEIQRYLLNKGYEIGGVTSEVAGENTFEITYSTGEKIDFDGNNYHLTRR